MAEVVKENADMTVITGDFTSLSLDFEFERISNMLDRAGFVPERTMVLPGNHDRYTFLADKTSAFERGMAKWLPPGFSENPTYPIVMKLGPVCLAGLDTAVWRGPVRAAGAVDAEALTRLTAALNSEEMKSLVKVIALHHPPVHRGSYLFKNYRTGLEGYEKFIESVPKPAIVIHGHTHIASRVKENGLDIIGVPSASNNTGNPVTQLAYNKYILDEQNGLVVETVRLMPDSNGELIPERSVHQN